MKKKHLILKTMAISASMVLLALSSCKSSEESAEEVAETVDCGADSLSFKADILPIFEANCFSCHNEEKYATKADGNLMVGYSDIKKYLDEGLIIGNIERTQGFIGMPYKKEKLDSCDIVKIKAWVAAGALEN